MADGKRRSARQRAERKRSKYTEPDSDDFEEEESDGEADYQPEPQPGPSQPQRSRKKRKISRKPRPETRAKEKRRQRFGGRPAGPTGRRGLNWTPSTPSKNKENTAKLFTGPSDGKIPDWTRLPAEILRQIFIFASQPIHEQTTTAISNLSWLMRSARLCRTFAVPALEAFYQFPAFHSSLQPHDLLELVKRTQDELYMNYKYRIKEVNIDIRRLTYVAHNKPPFQVGALLEQLPRLQSLEIVHPLDAPPYRMMYKCQSWQYPEDLFGSLEKANIRLKRFRWTRRMITHSPDNVPEMYQAMTDIHNSKPFQDVTSLVLCGFDFNNSALEIPEGVPSRPHGLAAAISALPHVKDLTFISCDIVVEDFLEHLPPNLERLELRNCLEVTSYMLRDYLEKAGTYLRELVLDHNAALNLGFLDGLRSHCPRLEVLKMDLTYYSERFNFSDAIALYDYLLSDDQIPTWPTTLRHLELHHLQKWEAGAAQNLFRSLVDSAKDLPDLRYLSLQAHINIPWRDRAGFRDQWIERLQRVYLRKNEPPESHLGSLRQFRLWKQAHGARPSGDADTDEHAPILRRLSHVQVTPRQRPPEVTVYSAVPSPSPRPRRSTRVAESQSASTAAEEEESSSDTEDDGVEDWRKQPEAFIQGLCTVVDIRIDNQRPRENQYTEANFLDSEPSGDEDWREGAEGSDDDRYAW